MILINLKAQGLASLNRLVVSIAIYLRCIRCSTGDISDAIADYSYDFGHYALFLKLLFFILEK